MILFCGKFLVSRSVSKAIQGNTKLLESDNYFVGPTKVKLSFKGPLHERFEAALTAKYCGHRKKQR